MVRNGCVVWGADGVSEEHELDADIALANRGGSAAAPSSVGEDHEGGD